MNGRLSVVLAVTAVVAVTMVAACARAYPPPGGERDTAAPRLLGTTPEALAVVAAGTDPVVLRFDERLSERNFTEALVVVSPLDAPVRVSRSGSEVRIAMDGGWRADRVYRVMLLPGVRDLFGNVKTEPVELVFSTGPPVTNTAIAGIVLDRVTGRAGVNPVIDAVRRADTVRYTTVADSAGFFALRHLPLGVYDVRAYADANRNRRRDDSEPVDSGRIVNLAGPADTVAQIFHVLAPDSTAPAVVSASPLDSLHVRVVLDDHVDPQDASRADVQLFVMPDSTGYARSVAGWVEVEYGRQRAARADSAAADSMVADSAAADTLPRRTERAPPRAGARMQALSAEPLPARELVFQLDRPLAAGTDYVLFIGRVRNLSGLEGSGYAAFRTAEAARPQPPPGDTTAVFPLRR